MSDRALSPELRLDEPTIGTLASRQTQLSHVNGERGTILSFDLMADQWPSQGSSLLANWVLYDPSNQVIAQPSWTSPDFSAALPTTGLYALAIASRSGNPIHYEFSIAEQSPVPVVNAGLGIVQRGSFAAGETVEYAFTANDGTKVPCNSLNQTNGQVRFRLINPDESLVFDNQDSRFDQEPWTLQQ